MLFDRTHRWFTTIHSSNIFAHRRATFSAVMQWLNGKAPVRQETCRTFDPSLRCKPYCTPSKAYDSPMLNIGFVTGSRRTCTDQLTGIHLSSGESFLSRDTWIDMVKHQICTRVDDWPSAINCTRCWSPSMHLSDPGGVRNSVSQRWKPV